IVSRFLLVSSGLRGTRILHFFSFPDRWIGTTAPYSRAPLGSYVRRSSWKSKHPTTGNITGFVESEL
ncbi:hypothetical protein QDX27_15920, partial [Rhizobium sp. BR 318]|uniref:hypothetical protein n=1 Tax=Rhizobium sp. BR 318 TaxID=3040669 RepID=UPI002F42D6DB